MSLSGGRNETPDTAKGRANAGQGLKNIMFERPNNFQVSSD